jgi:hypothetical protein
MGKPTASLSNDLKGRYFNLPVSINTIYRDGYIKMSVSFFFAIGSFTRFSLRESKMSVSIDDFRRTQEKPKKYVPSRISIANPKLTYKYIF